MKHINLIQMLQGCSKRNGMTVSATMHDDGQNCNVKQRAELMSEDEKWSENGALSPTCPRIALVLPSFCSRLDSVSIVSRQSDLDQVRAISVGLSARVWRYVALMVMVFGLGIGEMWGDVTLTVSETSSSVWSETFADGSVLYSIDSNGRSDADNNTKNFKSTDIVSGGSKTTGAALADSRFAIKFPVAVSAVTFYGYNSSSGRSISKVYTSTTMAKSSYTEITSSTTKNVSSTTPNYSYTFTASWATPIDANTAIWFQLSNTCNIYKIVYTPASSPRTFKSGEKIYFKDYSANITWGELNNKWVSASGEVYAHFWNATTNETSSKGIVVSGSKYGANAIYEITVPGTGKEWTGVLFTRGNDSNKWWNQTTDQNPEIGKNLFCISNDGDYKAERNPQKKWKGTWSKYAPTQALIGDFNDWDPDQGEFVDGRVILELEANTDYEFKVLVGDGTNNANYWSCTECAKATNTVDPWQQLYSNQNNWSMRSAEAGEYCFHWNNSTHYLGIYYPQARLKAGEYIYFDSRDNSTWKAADFTARYYFKYYDSGEDQSNKDCTKANATDTWVYNTTVPNNDYIGRVQMNRMVGGSQNGVADLIYAKDRTSSKQNCIHIASGSTATNWTTYCPPMNTLVMADNGTTTYGAGDGTSAHPYIVAPGSTIKVHVTSATTVPDDPNMTKYYQFKNGSSSIGSESTSTEATQTAGSDGTTHTIIVEGRNKYNDAASTVKKCTLYYAAKTIYDITYNKGSYGTGTSPIVDKKIKGVNITLRGVTYTRTGYTQTAWNTNSAGTGGTSYALSASYSSNAALTLYPTWTAKTTSVTLNPNTAHHGTGSNVVATATFDGTSLSGFSAATPVAGYRLEGYYTAATSGDKILNADGSYVKNTTYTTNDGTPKWKSELSSLELFAHYEQITYTVTFVSNNGDYGTVSPTSIASVPHGSAVSINGSNVLTLNGTNVTPTPASSTAQYTYAFSNWSVSSGTAITSAQTITATFTRTTNTYTVTWKNYDGTTLETDEGVAYGTTPTYDGSTPTKTADLINTYAFSGWSPAVGAITGNTIYTAQFAPTPIDYAVSATLAQCAVKDGSAAIPATMNYGDDFSTIIEANDEYTLPSTISVSGVTSYTWNQATGALTLTDVTGAVSISITAEAEGCTPQSLVKTVITGYESSAFQQTTTGTKAGTPIIDLKSDETQAADLDGDEKNETGYKMIGSKKFYVQLSGTTLKAGDIIKVGITKPSDYYTDPVTSKKDVLIICAWNGSTEQDSIGKITGVSGAGFYTYTVKAADLTRCEGANDSIHYVGLERNRWSQNPYMYSIEVLRPCPGSTYELTWNTNGGSELVCTGTCTSGDLEPGTILVAPTNPTLSNYTFDGWKTNNDGTGSAAAATMPSADTEYFAAWKQTVTLKTGAQGSGADQTPYVYINGTGVNSFTAHTASGYTLQGYYTAGSGGVKVLNADGTFAAANVTDYITSSKWSRTGAAPTLFAQWRAAAGKTCYTWDAEETHPQTGTNSYGGLYLTISQKGKYQFNSGGTNDTCFYTSSKGHYIKGHINGTVIDSLKFKASTENGDKTAVVVAFCSTYPYDTAHIIQVNSKDCKVYSVNKYDAAESFIKIKAPTGAKSFAIGRNFETELSVDGTLANSGKRYIYYVEACSAGGGTHTISYNAGGGTGTMSSNTGITDDGSQPLTTNSFTAPTNYSFAGWVADVNVTIGGSTVTAGTLIANGATITNITVDIALTAKWSQSVTLDANTSNHGSGDNGSATAYYNATSLSSVTHTKAATGYKLSGYYTAATSGTKVLNADGSFASANVTDWISSGKWICVASTRTLFAQYESAGALTWNLIVDSDTANLSTSTKTSAFTKISTANMSNATVNGLTYKGDAKASLTGKISTPAHDAGKYVYVTFQVAAGYKFIPSLISVPIQPVGDGEHKAVELSLTDTESHSLVSGSATKCDGTEKGKKTTVTLAGDGSKFFEGTVTLKIYVYPHASATATKYNCYRLGTPITIEGEIEEACATMPSYKSMSYTTTTFAPGADASGSPITIVGGDNINTYQWKYNRVNDRTSGTNCGTNNASLTPLTDAGAAIDGTRYYWCEMTNGACGITIKSPAVAIMVAAAKSDATVAWTDPASTPNYGGGGYTIKATVTEWDGNAADLVITAPAGINIYNVTSGTTSSQKWVQADFDVQTSFDRTTYASNIPFTVSAAATASYNAISNDHNVSYSACAGAGEGSSYKIRMRKTVTKDGNYYHCANTDGWISPNINSSYSTGKAGTTMAPNFDTVASSNTQYVWVRTYHANVNKVRIYADFRANDMTVSKVYKHTAYFSADSKYEVDYTAVYNDDEENENTGTAAQGYVDITLDEVMAANDILLVKFNDSKVRPLGAIITEGSAGSLNTHLQWSGGLTDGETVAKNTTDAYFTYSASKITENTNTLGTITYSSSNTSVATVDATGKVAMVAAGSTTIKATLAASGCYKKAEISYTLNVTVPECTIAAGTLTLTSGTESKCSSDKVTLTLKDFESGATLQWKDGDTNIDDGGNYKIESDGTTSTLTTDQEGTYSVMVTSGCSVRSNRITISNKSTEVGAKRIVKNWYIKNGRPTPDIELWTLQNGAHLSSVAWDPVNATGLTASDFYESDGKVYLKGKEPSSNTSGADIDYTLTLTVADDCGSTTAMSAAGQLIYLHHQKNTDKHVLAFVVTGTEKGGFTEGITAEQTTGVELYNTIAANFDVLATNVYSTDDEQALKEYYSQFDILCVTDYPNTGTKGVNKKSYVDALGALVDIRPILTMEAFVAKLANWKAKGISGTPQSPTTRQYTMLLQCKDHEIFSGTKLTKVGEGDETMYRVSMVCDTLEDYKTLDATYGAGTHEKDKNYQYGKKPALQGFTFTKEMLDDDLLPLGLIDDGSGNDLQVGIERQRNMEARLMVLGINSYAMERLTDDGQTVVVNALKYLMKKNSEDIADCSNMFVGGDDEEDESTRSDWNVASHWSGNAVPDRTQKVRIVAPCVIKADDKVHVAGVVIAPRGKYNHGANTANGSLKIAAGGALIVDGKVEAATAPLYTETRPTSPSDLTIQADEDHQGALIFDNDKGETQATVEMYSPSFWEVMEGTNKKKSYWSYVGVPIQDVPVGEYFYGAVTYLYDETSGWIRKRIGSEFHAFEGIGLSLPAGNQETFYGTLASTETKEITLTKTTDVGEGDNLIGNSWTAPIQIGNFDASDFGSATAVVSMYKTGRDDIEGSPTVVTATAVNDGAVEAGQWVSIPIGLPGTDGYDGPTVIPSMQAFQVTTSSETTLTLDYDKLVRDVTIATDNLTQPMSAPKRNMKRAAKKSLDAMMRVRMSGFKTRADLWIMEDGRFSDEYDNGWEANYIECDNRSPQLYANSEIGKMAFLAKPDIEGTILGIAPSLDGNEYLFTFHYVGDEEFYLNDLKLKQSVLISEEESYSFMYEDGDTNRFYISRTRIDAPQMPTGVENTHGDAVKARKFIYNDKLYIMLNGRVYSAEGQIVK